MPFVLFAQTKQISGTVTDTTGTGIPLVTVTEKGTQNSTATTADGKFKLNILVK